MSGVLLSGAKLGSVFVPDYLKTKLVNLNDQQLQEEFLPEEQAQRVLYRQVVPPNQAQYGWYHALDQLLGHLKSTNVTR